MLLVSKMTILAMCAEFPISCSTELGLATEPEPQNSGVLM